MLILSQDKVYQKFNWFYTNMSKGTSYVLILTYIANYSIIGWTI